MLLGNVLPSLHLALHGRENLLCRGLKLHLNPAGASVREGAANFRTSKRTVGLSQWGQGLSSLAIFPISARSGVCYAFLCP